MSEYQYYEFRTVNRQLTAEERKRVNALSSHGETTATSFSVTYNYGNFKHSENNVLATYFDIFFYISNWGSLTLKFCYPAELVDTQNWEPYYIDDENMTIESSIIKNSVILTFHMNSEDGFGWIEGEEMLDGLVNLYHDILHGDYRVFYLGWLCAMGKEDSMWLDEETVEPPIPRSLAQLSPALQCFADMFQISNDSIAAATLSSGSQPSTEAVPVDEKATLAALTHEESVDFLHRFLQGEPHLAIKLKQHIGLLQPAPVNDSAGTRTVGMLREAQVEIRTQRERAAVAAKEAQRQTNMQALADRGDQAWQEVENLIEQKNSAGYRQAAILLQQLGELADARHETALFDKRMEQIRSHYRRRSSFINALDLRGL